MRCIVYRLKTTRGIRHVCRLVEIHTSRRKRWTGGPPLVSFVWCKNSWRKKKTTQLQATYNSTVLRQTLCCSFCSNIAGISQPAQWVAIPVRRRAGDKTFWMLSGIADFQAWISVSIVCSRKWECELGLTLVETKQLWGNWEAYVTDATSSWVGNKILKVMIVV